MSLDPVTIVELEQPRCVLRFGLGACPAAGPKKCYNTWTTCKARSAYAGTGSIRWRFIRADQDRRLAQLRDDAARLDHDLATQEGADAPLSDYLRDAAGRLWSR